MTKTIHQPHRLCNKPVRLLGYLSNVHLGKKNYCFWRRYKYQHLCCLFNNKNVIGTVTALTWIVPAASGINISLPGSFHQFALPAVLHLLRYHRIWTQVTNFHSHEVFVEIGEGHPGKHWSTLVKPSNMNTGESKAPFLKFLLDCKSILWSHWYRPFLTSDDSAQKF